MDEHKNEDTNGFSNFHRMGYQIYQDILIRTGDRTKPKKSNYKKALSVGIKLQ
ncbi:hypothetical protein DPMN_162720 [Dreissena polymorpha]|uniref:Uncharacterized protein n=1 Tax=Dreissena polymorpha TaxID=45954 RepID=A0A9D4ESU6_DREPO|nr:hypothetical protein DPMN_162720 [Dreissena polymorpha]